MLGPRDDAIAVASPGEPVRRHEDVRTRDPALRDHKPGSATSPIETPDHQVDLFRQGVALTFDPVDRAFLGETSERGFESLILVVANTEAACDLL